MKNSGVYAPENLKEEALMVMGRVNAFADYVRKQDYNIEREMCAVLLGFDLEEKPAEEPEAEVEKCPTSE